MVSFIYFMTGFLYILFIVRFILSWIFGDSDTDIDTDIGSDLSLSDVVTFKGVTHFGMGFFGWLSSKQYLSNHIVWYDWIIAVIVGIIFMLILYFVYKLMFKLESKPTILSGTKLIGSKATVYLILPSEDDYFRYVITVCNGVGTTEIQAKSKAQYRIGDVTTIINFENEEYLI